MQTVACNLCGSTNTRHRFTLPDFLLERRDVSTTLVECGECGLIYQNPRPTLEEMASHYPPEYESYSDQLVSKKLPWLLRQALQYGIFKRCRQVTRYKSGGRILDIGCATGTFLQGMQDHGNWELYGVEVSEFAANVARSKMGLNVYTGTLEQAAFPEAFFDVITLWDVLEHLHDPRADLREIHRVLKPDGLLLIRVPNIQSWDARVFGPYWSGLDAPRHLYVFTPTTLAALLKTAGFKVVEQSCNTGIYPIFLLDLRFWLVAKNVWASFRQALMKVLYHPIIRLSTVPFFYIIGRITSGPLVVMKAVKLTPQKS